MHQAPNLHLTRLITSYQKWTGKTLVPTSLNETELIDYLFNAPFALLSHGTEQDPLLNYGNKLVLTLWEMTGDELIRTPSRLTAEAPIQSEREKLLHRVKTHGFIDDYSGIRISKTGKRFEIKNATVWNIVDETGSYQGQAATFNQWKYL